MSGPDISLHAVPQASTWPGGNRRLYQQGIALGRFLARLQPV